MKIQIFSPKSIVIKGKENKETNVNKILEARNQMLLLLLLRSRFSRVQLCVTS